jgi:long-chain acyl-CoA synthetase
MAMGRQDMAEAVAHQKGGTAASVGALFLDRVELTPDWEAFRRPTDPGWKSYTWGETGRIVEDMAAGLLALGVEPEQRVGIASSTILDWIFADLAIMCAGAATTTVYPSTPTEDVAFILDDSGSVLVFAEDKAQADKLRQVRSEIPNVTKVVMLTDFDAADGDWVITEDDLVALGKKLLEQDPDVVRRTVAGVKPSDLATIIYTSGTTGRPKGVRLTHANWVYEGDAMDSLGILRSDDLEYLWLPLAHSFGKVLISGQLKVGFAAAVDGRVDKIVEHLGEVKPTFIAAVPRIFEKIYGGIQTMQEREGGVKLKIFRWAEGVGAQAGKARREGKPVGRLVSVQHGLADKLVFSKIRDRLGGRVRYFVSGSAPLSREVGEWMDNVGLIILEGYGLTETSAFTFVNRPHKYRFGTVGEPADGTEVTIASDGEVLIKGPGVMEGYHNLPEVTAEVFVDGWFRTGDIGELEDGLLKITDRKKDLIKTSGGKYVAPQSIEVKFKAACPYASNIVVHGDGRNFVSALVTLDEPSITTWAAENGISGSYAEIVAHPKTKEMVAGYIDEVNAQLPRWETVKKFEILPEDLSIEAGELTPSLKVKRKTVEQKHASLLDSFYA